jgi:acyl-CoA thioester hydrolase
MEELDLATSFQDTKMGIVIASSSCKFRAPLKYPDRILVGAKVTTVDEFRFTMLYRIVSLETNRVAAQGDALCVGYNLAKQETSNLNPELIEKIGLLEGRNIIP